MLKESDFLGEGHRPGPGPSESQGDRCGQEPRAAADAGEWAAGPRTARKAPAWGPWSHSVAGSTTDVPNELWGTDATRSRSVAPSICAIHVKPCSRSKKASRSLKSIPGVCSTAGPMETTMARAVKRKKTYKAVTYIRRFFNELNLFAVAGKTSPAFPQYSNKGRGARLAEVARLEGFRIVAEVT